MNAYDRIRQVALDKGDDFDAMLGEYLREGIVVSNPLAFLMALPIRYQGEQAWFVKAAAGDMKLLARMFPTFRAKIVFNRSKGSDKVKVYDSLRLLSHVDRTYYPAFA